MPGSRYEDWHHTRYEGDVEAGKALLPLARKVLGFTVQQAGYNDLLTHKHVHRLPGGAQITGEINGGIPRVTIFVPFTDGSPERRYPPNDFVVWARTSVLPAGIDPDRPQQILRPEWRTYFDSTDTAGYDAFAGEKGTYGGQIPEGLLYAGNSDWKHADGRRISWYGPSARYWYDVWRQPRAQYGKHVFHFGRVLLDVDAYVLAAEPEWAERWVLGAAIRGSRLYVVMADLPATVTWPTPPASAAFGPDAWSTPLYPITAIPIALRSFQLAMDDSATPPRPFVVGGSDRTLWADVRTSAAAPWHFDEKGERAVCHMPPVEPRMYFRGLGNLIRPSATHQRLELVIDFEDDSATLSSSAVSMAAGINAAGVFAEDGASVLEVVRRDVLDDEAGLVYRLHGHEYPAFMSVFSADGDSHWMRRQIMWADLREGVLLLWCEEVFGDLNPWTFRARVVLCRGGIEQVLWEDGNTVNNFVSGDVLRLILDRLNAAAVAPMALAHLLPMGAMTDAGGVGTFDAQASLLHPQWGKPARKSEYYGQVVYAFTAGPWTNGQSAADMANDIAANTQTDLLGRHTHPGFASHKGWTLVSYPMNAGINARRVVLHHAADGLEQVDLATLTGVAGSDITEAGIVGYDARYHPIWILGPAPGSAS